MNRTISMFLKALVFSVLVVSVSAPVVALPPPGGGCEEEPCDGEEDPDVPLDDFAPILLLGGAVVGFYTLQKKKLAK